MKKLLVLVLAVLLIVFSAVGASAKDSPKAKVRVSITADEGTKNIISKFVERELQGLPDVEIVENDADYTFVILAVEIFNKSGVKTGISLSLLFLEKFHNKFLDTMIDKKSKFKGFIIKHTSDLYYKPRLRMHIGSMSDIESICAEIVADFEKKHLVEIRNVRRLEQEINKQQ